MADICHNRPDPPWQNISTKHRGEMYLFFLQISYTLEQEIYSLEVSMKWNYNN